MAYSTAKAAGIEMCFAYNRQYGTMFVPCILCNSYGVHDDFGESSHVLAAMMRKMHQAKVDGLKEVSFFGTGVPLREFMYVEDLAAAAVLILSEVREPGLINIGGGTETSIRDLAHLVKKVTGYSGNVTFDATKPDGAMRKLCDGGKLKSLGFEAKYGMEEGIRRTYAWYLSETM